jgi:hypothetical protein
LIQTPPYELGDEFKASEKYNHALDIVEEELSLDNPDALKSEMVKFYLRIRDFNVEAHTDGGVSPAGCHGDIDVLTLEEEFWNAADPDMYFWDYHLGALQAMASIRDINNMDTTNNPLMVEDYFGKFHNDTIDDQLQADTMDEYIDRFLLTFYVGWTSGAAYDYPTHFFSATNQQWQEQRMVLLGNNSKQTVIWPLFESGWVLPTPTNSGRPSLAIGLRIVWCREIII